MVGNKWNHRVKIAFSRRNQNCIVKKKGRSEMEKISQTAGRNTLGNFAPEFAHYNDDVLFGENWNNHDIHHKTRCIVTVVALMSPGVTDSSLKFHLENAKKAEVTKKEIEEVITHTVFMPDDRRAGSCSTWQRKCGMRKLRRRMKKRSTKQVSILNVTLVILESCSRAQ